jgi:hypothetical protein
VGATAAIVPITAAESLENLGVDVLDMAPALFLRVARGGSLGFNLRPFRRLRPGPGNERERSPTRWRLVTQAVVPISTPSPTLLPRHFRRGSESQPLASAPLHRKTGAHVYETISDLAPAFPLAAADIAPLRAKAESAGFGDFSPLGSGQDATACREVPAAELPRELALRVEQIRRVRLVLAIGQIKLQELLHDEAMLQADLSSRGKVDEIVRVLEHAQGQKIGDHFEMLHPKDLGEFSDFDIIRHKNALSGLARIQNIPRRELGWPRRWLRRTARKSRLGFRGFFGWRCEVIATLH